MGKVKIKISANIDMEEVDKIIKEKGTITEQEVLELLEVKLSEPIFKEQL